LLGLARPRPASPAPRPVDWVALASGLPSKAPDLEAIR
jgi:hypothetical protein